MASDCEQDRRKEEAISGQGKHGFSDPMLGDPAGAGPEDVAGKERTGLHPAPTGPAQAHFPA